MPNASLKEYFQVWDKLTEEEKDLLEQATILKTASAGTLLHSGLDDCDGLFIVRSGQLRAYALSEEGKEFTIYRLLERDICLFSASCIMHGIQFDITVEAEKDTEIWIIPLDVYKTLMESSTAVANYTNQILASRFSEVMWLVEQILWKSMDKRLAAFLLEESALEESDTMKITHQRIADHLGTAREVVTRMLRYFQSEGIVTLARGCIELRDPTRLRDLAE